MQKWPLARKIQATQAKILEWYLHYNGKVYVSFSGGKDSAVLLDLARRAAPEIPAAFVDTGLEYLNVSYGKEGADCPKEKDNTVPEKRNTIK